MFGELFQSARASRPLPRFCLGAAGQPELAEKNVAQLLGTARIDGVSSDLVDFSFKPGRFLGELAGKPRQQITVDGNAAALHSRQHRHQRPLQCLVHRQNMLGGQPRPQHLPETQQNVSSFGGVFGRAVDADGIEGDAAFARFDQVVEIERRVVEGVFGQRNEAVIIPAGVERIRHQHGVVVGRDLDAAQRKYLPGEFQIVADLEHAEIGEQRRKRFKRGPLGNLVGRDIALEQACFAALAPLAM